MSPVLDGLSLASLLGIQVVLSLRVLESGTHRRHPGQRNECGSDLCIIISRVWKVDLVPWGAIYWLGKISSGLSESWADG